MNKAPERIYIHIDTRPFAGVICAKTFSEPETIEYTRSDLEEQRLKDSQEAQQQWVRVEERFPEVNDQFEKVPVIIAAEFGLSGLRIYAAYYHDRKFLTDEGIGYQGVKLWHPALPLPEKPETEPNNYFKS